MSEGMKHTPGEWSYQRGSDCAFVILDGQPNDDIVPALLAKVVDPSPHKGTSEGNAAFIVLAVNAHDDLLAACEAAQVTIRKLLARNYDETPQWVIEDADVLAKAIAKAQGGSK